MISKEQFLELKHLKSLGVPTTTICRKIGISVPSANKWLRMDEDAFENYQINNTPSVVTGDNDQIERTRDFLSARESRVAHRDRS